MRRRKRSIGGKRRRKKEREGSGRKERGSRRARRIRGLIRSFTNDDFITCKKVEHNVNLEDCHFEKILS
jgi:hypothetical protein